jgi:Rne/Rng family ribonuclease
MNKEMIISSNGHETRVAILEDDQLAELFVEREQNRGVVGNVYKGRVSKVLPGMQSSFVDIGLERDGFLYVSDVIADLDEYDKDDDEDDGAKGAKVPMVPMVRRVPMVPTVPAHRAKDCRRRPSGAAVAAIVATATTRSARPSRRSKSC